MMNGQADAVVSAFVDLAERAGRNIWRGSNRSVAERRKRGAR